MRSVPGAQRAQLSGARMAIRPQLSVSGTAASQLSCPPQGSSGMAKAPGVQATLGMAQSTMSSCSSSAARRSSPSRVCTSGRRS